MSISIENEFTVPLPLENAWPVLLDIRRMANCMPGAELEEVRDDGSFSGHVRVKLGPISLVFGGEARFDSIDHDAFRVGLSGAGNEKKGRGRASAEFTFWLESDAENDTETRVRFISQVTLTGAVAQYGRAVGVVRTVSEQIISDFAKNLRADLAGEDVSSLKTSSLSAARMIGAVAKKSFSRSPKINEVTNEIT